MSRQGDWPIRPALTALHHLGEDVVGLAHRRRRQTVGAQIVDPLLDVGRPDGGNARVEPKRGPDLGDDPVASTLRLTVGESAETSGDRLPSVSDSGL